MSIFMSHLQHSLLSFFLCLTAVAAQVEYCPGCGLPECCNWFPEGHSSGDGCFVQPGDPRDCETNRPSSSEALQPTQKCQALCGGWGYGCDSNGRCRTDVAMCQSCPVALSPSSPPSPPPPSPPPPLPPAPPPAPPDEFAVTFSLKASGDVADYTDTIKDAMAAKVATSAGVDKNSVAVEVTAGSVNIEFTIRAATEALATTAGNAVQASVADASAATAFFSTAPGITITVNSVTAISAPASLKDAESSLSAGALAGIIIGAIAGVVIIGVFTYRTIFKKASTASKTTV